MPATSTTVAMNFVLPLLMLSSSASSSVYFSMRSDSFHSSAWRSAGSISAQGPDSNAARAAATAAFDVGRVCIGDGGDLTAGCGVDDGNALLGFRLDPLPADEQPGRVA